jgi:hypothetical protein
MHFKPKCVSNFKTAQEPCQAGKACIPLQQSRAVTVAILNANAGQESSPYPRCHR